MFAEIRAGIQKLADGANGTARATRQAAMTTADAQSRYYENTMQGQVFSLVQQGWTTGVAAGNLVGAAAAASTNFCIWNPSGSGKFVSILKFGVWISGTTVQNVLFHGYMATAPTNAHTVITPIAANNVGYAAGSVVRAMVSNAGTALTGNSAPAIVRAANLEFSGTTYANVAGGPVLEIVDGDIVIPQGCAYIPLWNAASVAMLGGYSLTWEEMPV